MLSNLALGILKIERVLTCSLLFVSFLSSCQVTPKPAIPTTIITNTRTQELSTSTPVSKSHPLQKSETPPKPTQKPLIPDDLKKINSENIRELIIFGEIPFSRIYPNNNIFFLTFSQDGSRLAAISENWEDRERSLMVWDLITNSPMLELGDQPFLLMNATFSPDGDQLWVIHDEILDRYDLQQGDLIDSVEFPDHDTMSYSPDGRYILAGVYEDSTNRSRIEFYKTDGIQLFFTDKIPYMISSFQFSPDNKMVGGISSEISSSLVRVWKTETGEVIKDLYNYDGGPVFSPDSQLAALVKGDTISIYSTDTWRLRSSFQNGTPFSPNFPQFFLDDNQILAIADTYDVSFNNARTGRELLALDGECNVDISTTNNCVITYCSRGTIRLWGILP